MDNELIDWNIETEEERNGETIAANVTLIQLLIYQQHKGVKIKINI